MKFPKKIFSKSNQPVSRNLYLHIGCGKTGSSALQLWLANNNDALQKAGIHYPLLKINKKNLTNYTITSGNGVAAMHALEKDEWEEFCEQLFNNSDQVVLSSESFQNASEEQLQLINSYCGANGITVNIIVYVRDAYDISYSAYVQGIKRHYFKQSFAEWIYQTPTLQQLQVLEKYEAVFSNISLLHYDSEKQRGLETSFCEALGIPSASVPAMKKHKVNRSLTVNEIQLLRLANEMHMEKFNNRNLAFCRNVSDYLIDARPELATEILYDKEVENFLSERYSAAIERINHRYLQPNQLCIFNRENKKIVEQEPALSPDTRLFIEAMMESIDKQEPQDQDPAKLPIRAKDQRLPEVLRSESIKRENTDLQSAYCLMHSAATFRPKGPFILAKLKEYETRLQKESEAQSDEKPDDSMRKAS